MIRDWRDYWWYRVRRAGIPVVDCEDAVQEILLAHWQGRAPRWALVDALRRYGPNTRRRPRPRMLQLEHEMQLYEMQSYNPEARSRLSAQDVREHLVVDPYVIPETYPVRARMLTLQRAWRQLTDRQREILTGRGKTSSDQRRYAVRRKLRRLCAA